MSRVFVVLGGGSAYAPGLIAALIHHRAPVDEVRLYDTDQDRLALVGRLGAKMAESQGAGFSVRPVAELDRALAGASVVLASARPGGLECRAIDEALPLELGIPGQETVGPGGFFFALRSVPFALDLAERLTRIAPGAVLLNYTNPTNILTQVLSDRTQVRVLGLCDQSAGDLALLGRALGEPGAAEFRCIGLNHATWYSHIHFGKRAFDRAPAQLVPPADVDADHQLRFRIAHRLAAAEAPGLWPNSYWALYAEPQAFVALMQKEGSRAQQIMAALPGYYRHFAEEADKPVPELRQHRGDAGFGDLAVDCLDALASDGKSLVLNVPNRGMSASFADDTVIEARVSVSRTDLVRATAPEPPASARSLLQQLEAYQRLTAEAAVSGEAKALQRALAANPLVASAARADALLLRAKGAYGKHIPQLAS